MLPQRDRNGFSLQLEAAFDVDCVPMASAEDGARLADILDGSVPSGAIFHVPLRTLCRHALVAGMTGSGKSTTVRALLAELGRRRVPFLVLEPAKAEYHRLADVVDGLLVFRLGAAPRESEVLFQLNPFYFPDGFPLHTHLDFLKQAMVASFGLHPPAPYLLETALHRVYERRGWDLGTGMHPQGRHGLAFPTLSDLLDEVGPVVDAAGYDREVTRNLKGALKTRIGNLCIGAKGAMLNTRENLPDELLFGAPVVLELKDLGSDEEKALVMGLVLTRLYEVRERGGALAEEKLRHLLVIEEAHRLLRRTADRTAEEGDMQGQAVQTFANILSEVRAFGQGVMVVEQLPGKLAPDVVKNTSLKVIHRMAPRDDRDAVGDAMNLDEPQKRFLTVLPQGEAVIHTEGMDGAIRVRVRPAAAARAAATHASETTRSRLPADLVSRLDRGALRLRLSQGLDHPEVNRAADGVVLELSHASAATAARTTLNETLTRVFSVASPGRAKDQIREAATFAVEEALRRLALRHHFTSSAFEKVASAGTRMGTVLPGLLEQTDGPFPYCVACPVKCRYLYLAERLADDQELRQSLRAVLDAPPRTSRLLLPPRCDLRHVAFCCQRQTLRWVYLIARWVWPSSSSASRAQQPRRCSNASSTGSLMDDRTRDTTDRSPAERGELPADSEKTNAWMAAERARDLRARDMQPPTPEQELARLERIGDRSSMRGMPDFDPKRELDLENFRIRNDPEGYLKTLDGAGLDYATEHEVKKALERAT